MHFKITQEMKQRIIVYSASLIIAILFFTILNRFKDITRFHSVHNNNSIPFPSWNWFSVYIEQSAKMG